jgi:hypothetical protein
MMDGMMGGMGLGMAVIWLLLVLLLFSGSQRWRSIFFSENESVGTNESVQGSSE